MASQTRAKFGYLSYNTMLSNIAQETDPKKKLDAYDLNFTPDTKECYIIAPDLTPWAIKSKVYTFDNIDVAIEQLNQNTDTYAGQIVAILHGNKYVGYIVNNIENKFSVSPLYEHPEEVDYNTLGNKPITNLIGTLDNPINAEELDSGIYAVKGQYVISTLYDTIFLSASDTILIVNQEEHKIKRITTDEIVDYIITSNDITSSSFVTSDFLDSEGYATEQYVDEKIAALEIVTRKEVEEYVNQLVNEVINTNLNEKIDQILDEKLQSMDESDIDNLF